MGRLYQNFRWPGVVAVVLLWSLAGSGGSPRVAEGSMLLGFQAPQDAQTEESESTRALARKQKKDLLKNNFEKMKRDADELADLAKSLQDDLNKSSEHVLSIQIVEKAEKIEKLAHRIKSTAKGF